MNFFFQIKNYLWIILLFSLIPNKGFCKNIELLHVDSLQKNEKFIFLVGNIHLKYNKYHLFCDKAIYYKRTNKFYGYGKVKLISKKSKILSKNIEYISGLSSVLRFSGGSKLYQKNTKLFADSINYFLRKKLFQAVNHVIFHHNNIKLKTNTLEYDLKSKKLFYKKGAFINYDNKINIYSKKGVFDENKKKAKLKDGVKIFYKNYTIYSDAMEYLLQKKIFLLRKNLKIYYNRKVFTGNFLLFDQKKRQISFNHLSLIKEDDKKENFSLSFKKGFGIFDLNKKSFLLRKEPNINIKYKRNSIFIHANFIKIFVKKDFSYLIHASSIKNFIFNKYIKVKCKLLIFDSSKKRIKFFGDPAIFVNDQRFYRKNLSIKFNKK